MTADRERDIAEAKRAVWAQPGAGQEYQYFAYKGSPVKRLKNLIEIGYVTRHAKGSLVLDAGAGTGRFTFPMRQRDFSAIALDISREMLDEGRKVSVKTGVPFPCGIGLIEHLPFADATFDSVVSITVLRHFPEWPAILREYLRVVKPGGRVVFDMGSGEQRLYLKTLGIGVQEPAGPLEYEAAVTAAELERMAAALNCAIVSAVPHDFLNDNPLLRHLLGDRWNAFETELFGLLESADNLGLCEVFSRRFLSSVSPVAVPSWLVVLEKGSAGSRSVAKPYLHAAPVTVEQSPLEQFVVTFQSLLGYRFTSAMRELEAYLDHAECRELMALFERTVLSADGLRMLTAAVPVA